MVINRVDPDLETPPSWAIEGQPLADDMFALNSVVRRIRVVRADAILLSGISALDIHDSMPDAWENIDRLGFTSRVDFANFIGAAYLEKHKFHPLKGAAFTQRDEQGVVETIFVGGDMHGDFRMRKNEVYPEGSIDPMGKRRDFAPLGDETVLAAYHSSEPDILYQALRYLNAIDLSEHEQLRIVRSAVFEFMDWLQPSSDAEEKNPFVIPFADYGSHDDEFWARHTVNYFGDPARQKRYQDEEQVINWGSLGIMPGESEDGFNITTVGKNLVLGNGAVREGVVDNYKEIIIKPDSIGGFIVAMLKQANVAGGRTSPRTLVAILSARQSGEVFPVED